jgi:hypothetical protein
MLATRTEHAERVGIDAPASTTQRFRAATIDEALAQVRASLGDDAQIVEANRIRRGGIGGFFATELGVEVVARGAHDLSEMSSDAPSVFEPFGAATAPLATPVARPIARQAWRDAAAAIDELAMPESHTGSHTGSPVEPGASSMVALIERADAIEREPSSFADHFLRELMHDADELRRSPSRNRVLPTIEPEVAAARREAVLSAPSVAPAAPRAAAPRRAPLGDQLPLPGVAAKQPMLDEPAHPENGEPTLPGMPAAAAKPRPRRKPTARRAANSRPEAAPPADDMIRDLIDHCVRLATADDGSEDGADSPSKIALAITLGDGSVIKVSVERPRTRTTTRRR